MQYLLRLPARVFALTYLLLIPAYAAVYTLLAGQFYHSTAAYERSIADDAEGIAEELKNAIVDGYHARYDGDSASFKGTTVSMNSIGVEDLRAKDWRLFFMILYKTKEFEDPIGVFVSLSPGEATNGRRDDGRCQLLLRDEACARHGPHNMSVLHDLCPGRPGFMDSRPANADGFLVLSAVTIARIAAFIQAERGFPSYSSGRFNRMFYFSAMTITTVGFGDIVPISDLTRALAASEAIFGVVLAGLFLNAIAQRVARQANPTSGAQ